MTQHPITPPPELVQAWSDEALTASGMFEVKMKFATYAVQWGADQELEACCQLVRDNDGYDAGMALLAERRIHSLSLKQQALEDLHIAFDTGCFSERQAETIRRALEQLDG